MTNVDYEKGVKTLILLSDQAIKRMSLRKRLLPQNRVLIDLVAELKQENLQRLNHG